MASSQEIRSQIASIQNTQKITKAMEMVAASKMKKAQDQMTRARPYADKISNVIAHLAQAHPEYSSEFFNQREVKKKGYIIISSDRGLCGGLNNNLFKLIVETIEDDKKKNIKPAFSLIGSKATSFFQRMGGDVMAQTAQLGDKPKIEQVLGLIKSTIDSFISGEIDEVYIVYNKFLNTVSQDPTMQKVLPIKAEEKDNDYDHYWDYLYEPDAETVLESLFTRYIESLVYRGLVENLACEQASRMVAMKAASDNATDLTAELQLIYNKNRQAAITQEISEIISGAAAL
jgi:F-type H+-transporting ATPase subunit gamma|tara:strand:+ start:330 stop:1193 length:864 start_codon:yes stop_codon:yes gene_type:complete